ncbi:MAG: DNA repair protein RecN [Chloroflexota bacterium]
MLLELKVKDLGIIADISWRLGNGLNVITGETGAGKSLVIDAVEALLAGRVDEEAIRHGADEARIEGVFALPRDGHTPLGELLAEKGLAGEGDTLAINCELRRQGRSVLRVNGNAVPRGLLRQIGRLLVDIHGQSQHLSLLDQKFQLDFLDIYGHNTELRQEFGDRASELFKTDQELRALAEASRDLARRQEFLRFQADEIARAKLREGEEEQLDKERNILSLSEQLKALSWAAYQALHGEETSYASASTIDRLGEAAELLKKLVDIDPALKQQVDFIEETRYGLEEAARDIRAYSDRQENDPARLEEIESRLELIKGLKRKYGQSVADVLAFQSQADAELAGFSQSTRRQSELEERRSRLMAEMGQIAARISQARHRAAKQLAAGVKRELQDLNMSGVGFEVSIKQSPDNQGILSPDGVAYAYNSDGIDTVEFMAATNPGEPLKPLARIASTGEISRFMLALKGALSQADSTPVLVFDEIDIGVGGRSGEVIGRKLWALARRRQVICVTHLPQIAAFADAHFSVHKESPGERTLSLLESLDGSSRLEELAVMLAGPQYGRTARENARELIQKAEDWKKKQDANQD